VNDHNRPHVRLRYTGTGALAALAAAGAIAGATALAANTHARPHRHAHRHAAVTSDRNRSAPNPSAAKHGPPAPPRANPQPLLNAIQRLVDNGTITARQGQILDRQIRAGRIDSNTLTGFTAAQLQAVQQALANVKRGLAAAAHSGSK
jgi:hypothetical protein